MQMIEILVTIFFIYLSIGFLFAIVFIVKGAKVIDESVSESPKTFRLLLIPGALLLWPVLLIKWVKK